MENDAQIGVAEARWGWRPLVVGSVVIAVTIIDLVSAKPYPACDDGRARAMLSSLSDNDRLLHETGVGVSRLVSDSVQGRSCVATVTWQNGLATEAPTSFSRGGRSNSVVSMWIDYNGGMRGPPF